MFREILSRAFARRPHSSNGSAAKIALAGSMFAALALPASQAAGVTWNGATSTNFETGTNWVSGTAPANDTITDSAVFTGTPTVNQPALTVNRSVGALQFGSTGGWTLSGGFSLTLGNILTVGSTTGVGLDASALTSGTDTITAGITPAGSQTWLVGNGGTLNVNTVSKPAGPAFAITIGDASNAGTVSFGGTTDNSYLGLTVVSGVAELNKTSTNLVHVIGSNTTITGGTLRLAGTGGDQIYDSANITANGGTFDFNGRSEKFGQLNGTAGGLVTNSSGTASTLTSSGGTYAGAVTGNLSIQSGSNATFSGSLTNTGNITNNTAATTGLTLSGTVNNTGVITNAGTNTGALTVSGTIGANVTGIVQNSATSTTIISGNNTALTAPITVQTGTLQANIGAGNLTTALGTGAITLGDAANTGAAVTLNFNNSNTGAATANAITTVGTGLATVNLGNFNETLSGAVTLGSDLAFTTTNNNNSTLTSSGAISGTGNLITKVGGTNAGSAIVLNGNINNVGTITNSGSNTVGGGTTINGIIGTNVTGVVQTSATSPLILKGDNTFTSGLTIKAGTVTAQKPGAGVGGLGGAAGIGTITLGDVANTGAAATLNWNFGFGTSGSPINVVGTGTRTLSVTSYGPTYTGAVTLNGGTTLNVVTNNTGGSNLVLSGGVTGTGNLVLQSNAALTTNVTSKVILQTGTINNAGTITNSGTGSVGGTAGATAIDTLISANIGSNVTNVIQNSANSALTLSGTNSYTGTTSVLSGKLITLTTGNLGLGDVTVAGGATLTLGNFNSINNVSNVGVAQTSTINLNFTGTPETIASLYNSTTSTFVPAGTYSISTLNSTYFGGGTTFAGTGSLTILSSVPEPSTWGLMGAALSALAIMKRRRRVQ